MSQKEMQINYMILRGSIVINFDSKNFIVNSGSDEYSNVLNIIKCSSLPVSDPKYRSLQELIPIVDPQKVISDAIPNGDFVVQKGKIYSDGQVVSGYIGQKLIEFVEQGLPYLPLFNFWKRIKNNPSNNSKDQLYQFLESNLIPLTEEGKFIAYKSVRSDMTDHHSGKFKYAINQLAQMDRSEVVDDPNHACGPGLHVGSFKYASSFGGNGSIILEVEVDPADVVSVPKDHASQKLRACQFIPVAVCQREYTSPVVITKKEQHTTPVVPKASTPAAPVSAILDENVMQILIGRDAYIAASLRPESFRALGTTFKEVVDIRPSKAATALRGFNGNAHGSVKSVTRFMDDDKKCYAVEYINGDVSTFFVFVPEGHTFVEPSASVVGEAVDFMKDIKVGNKVLSPTKTDTFALSAENYDNVRSLGRSKYPVALLELDTNSIIRRVLRGISTSTNDSVFLVDIGIVDQFIRYSAE